MIDALAKLGVEQTQIHSDMATIEPIRRESSQLMTKGEQSQLPRGYAQDDLFGDPSEGPNESSEEAPIGFAASRTSLISLRSLDKIEAIYRGLLERKGLDIRNIEFSTSDSEKYQNEVLQQAVRNGREKGKSMADELGAKLSSVQSMHESNVETDNDPFGGYGRPSFTTFFAGRLSIKASVEIVFRLSQTTLER